MGYSASAMAVAPDTGTHIQQYQRAEVPNSTRMSDENKARVTFQLYARCLVDLNRPRVEKFLAVSPYDGEFEKGASRLTTGDCLQGTMHEGVEMRFSPHLLRQSLYTALYAKDYKSSAPALTVDPLTFERDFNADPKLMTNGYVALRQFAECVIRADQKDSRTLTLSMAGSASETSAFQAIVPFLGPCLPQGNQLQFSKPMLTGLIAEVLYRLSKTSELAQARPEKN